MTITLETRIFLECRQGVFNGSGAGHMYLVQRQVGVENGVVVDNSYRPDTDRVIHATSSFSSGTPLVAEERVLRESYDDYGTVPLVDGSTRPEATGARNIMPSTAQQITASSRVMRL